MTGGGEWRQLYLNNNAKKCGEKTNKKTYPSLKPKVNN